MLMFLRKNTNKKRPGHLVALSYGKVNMDEREQEEINYEERDRLFYELVVRQSALERILIKNKIISEKDLAEAQVECMEKLQAVIEEKQKELDAATVSPTTGFIKYGEKHETNPHESQEKE